MRKKEREITDIADMLSLIESQTVMRIGMVDGNRPYVLPMNYGYTWENEQLTFYFHGATEGRKLDLLRQNNQVCFELDCEHNLIEGRLPCQYTFEFASIIGEGKMELVEDPAEKIAGIQILMEHVAGKAFDFSERLVSAISVLRLPVTSFTGKRRRLPRL